MPRKQDQNDRSVIETAEPASNSTLSAAANPAGNNGSNMQTPPSHILPGLKQDRKKRKTWVWVPIVEEATEEPEIIETNNSGRVKRTSMKKATENISASLVVRKPVSSKKNAGPKRGTSCMSTEYIVHSNIVDERNELAGNQEEETEFISPQPNNTEQTTEMAQEKGELDDSRNSETDEFIVVVDDMEPLPIAANFSIAQIDTDIDNQQQQVSPTGTEPSDLHFSEMTLVNQQMPSEELQNEEMPALVQQHQSSTETFELDSKQTAMTAEEHKNDANTEVDADIYTTSEEPAKAEEKKKASKSDEKKKKKELVSTKEKKKKDKEEKKKKKEEEEQEPEAPVLPIIERVPVEEWPPNPSFKKIDENLLLCKDAESKESKSIQCDCVPSSKTKKRLKACGDICLNRLLMMECGDECSWGHYCTNKRFQKREYANLEIFFTGSKGWGLRAKKDIKEGQFIIEYVGEIIDAYEMSKRIRRYGRDPNHKHHYLMALRSGTVIDATQQGNESRFINHSCEPNAATQKWTVGRQLRIGFFALKPIRLGEEITFNYQFERYGRKAQPCFCEAPSCTGFIGASKEDRGMDSNGEETAGGDESDSSSGSTTFSSDGEEDDLAKQKMHDPKSSLATALTDSKAADEPFFTRPRGRPRKHKHTSELQGGHLLRHHHQHKKRGTGHHSRVRPELISDPTLREQAEVNEILLRGPLRNRDQVLEFNRLMVRVDQMESRSRMIDFLLRIMDPNILRLFIANQGFALIRIWFVLPPFERRALQLQAQIARLLMRLPVTSKQVDEVCIMCTLKQMLTFELPDKFVVKDVVNQMVDNIVADLDGSTAQKPPNQKSQSLMREFETLKDLAAQLAEKWANLVEWEFRIPKKLTKTKSNGREDGTRSRHNHKEHQHKSVKHEGRRSISPPVKHDGFGNGAFGNYNNNNNDGGTEWRYRRFKKHYNQILPPHLRRRFHQNFRNGGGFRRGPPHRWIEEARGFCDDEPWHHQQQQQQEDYQDTDMDQEQFDEQDEDQGSEQYFNPDEPPPSFFNPPTVSQARPAPSAVLPPTTMIPPMGHQQQFYAPPFYPPYYFPGGAFIPPMYMASMSAAAAAAAANAAGYVPPPPPPPPKAAQDEEGSPSQEETKRMEIDQAEDEMVNVKTEPGTKKKKKVYEADPNPTPSLLFLSDAPEVRVKETTEKDNDVRKVEEKEHSKKSSKDLQAELLQRRLQSLRAALGQKAAPSQWPTGSKEQTEKQADDHRTSSRTSRSRSRSRERNRDRKAEESRRKQRETEDDRRKQREKNDDRHKSDDRRDRNRKEDGTGMEANNNKHGRSESRNSWEERRMSGGGGRGGRGRFSRDHGRGRDRRQGGGSGYKRKYSVSPERNGNDKDDKDANKHDGLPRQDSSNEGKREENVVAAANHKQADDKPTGLFKLNIANPAQRIKAHLFQKAMELQKKKNEETISPEEQKQRQQVHEVNKVVINMYTEKLKSLVQGAETDSKTVEIKPPESKKPSFSVLSELDAVGSKQRHRSVSANSVSSSSSDSSTDSLSSSTSSTSSSSSSSSSSSASSSNEDSFRPKAEDGKKKPEQQQTGGTNESEVKRKMEPLGQVRSTNANSNKPRAPPFNIIPIAQPMPKNPVQAAVKTAPTAVKGHFLPPKIAATPIHPQNQHIKKNMEEKQPNTSFQKVSPLQKQMKKEEEVEQQNIQTMMQPPQISVDILQDPNQLDGYIHQLKEFVYFMEIMRRDMHGAPPLPPFFAHQQQQVVNNPTALLAMRMHRELTKSSQVKRAHAQIQQEDHLSTPCSSNSISNENKSVLIQNAAPKRARMEIKIDDNKTQKPQNKQNRVPEEKASGRESYDNPAGQRGGHVKYEQYDRPMPRAFKERTETGGRGKPW